MQKHRTPALASLIAGYTMALGFGVLLAIVLSSGTTSEEDGELVTDDEVVEEGEIVSGLDALPQESDRHFPFRWIQHCMADRKGMG